MVKLFVLLLGILSLISCANHVPEDQKLKRNIVFRLDGDKYPEVPIDFLFISEPIVFNYNSKGKGLNLLKIKGTILAGEYTKVAFNSSGAYYAHDQKGFKFTQLGIPEYKEGGIFIPRDPSQPIKAWHEWSELVSTGTSLRRYTNKAFVSELPDLSLSEKVKIKDIPKLMSKDELLKLFKEKAL